jgi:hypothetical protein
VNYTDQRWTGYWELDDVSGTGAITTADIAAGPVPSIHAVYCMTGTDTELTYLKFDGVWGEWETVNEGSSETPEMPSVAADGTDVPYVLWVENLSGTKRIFFNSRGAQDWGTPSPVSSDQGDASEPHLVTDSSGNLHAVWVRVTGLDAPVYYATRPASGSWTTPVVISQTTGTCSGPHIAMDGAGGLHVAYSRTSGTVAGSEIYYVANQGTWSSPDLRSGSTGESIQPFITARGSGASLELDLVWSGDGTVADQVIWFSVYSSSAWSAPEAVSDDSNASDRREWPNVLRDSDSTPIVTGIRTNSTPFAEYYEKIQGTWAYTDSYRLDAATDASWRAVKDGDGHLHFLVTDGADQIFYRHRR